MTITNLDDANREIDRLRERNATLEDQVLRDDGLLKVAKERVATLERALGRRDEGGVPARPAIREALAEFHARMDVHEAHARALGVVVDAEAPTEPPAS